MKLHPDAVVIRKSAPSWAKWFVVCIDGTADWQCDRGYGGAWLPYGDRMEYFGFVGTDNGRFAIDLSNGDVHIQESGNKITIVPQAEWVAARKRKAA